MANQKLDPQNEEFMRQMAERTAKFNREMNVFIRRDKLLMGKATATIMPSRVNGKSRKATWKKQSSAIANLF